LTWVVAVDRVLRHEVPVKMIIYQPRYLVLWLKLDKNCVLMLHLQEVVIDGYRASAVFSPLKVFFPFMLESFLHVHDKIWPDEKMLITTTTTIINNNNNSLQVSTVFRLTISC